MWCRMTLSRLQQSRRWTEDWRPNNNVVREVIADFIERLWKIMKNDYSLFN